MRYKYREIVHCHRVAPEGKSDLASYLNRHSESILTGVLCRPQPCQCFSLTNCPTMFCVTYRTGNQDTNSTTSTTGALQCNSIGCPNGYTPIENAQTTTCSGDMCEVSQCCEAFCSYHPCPNGYTPVVNATTIACADSGCTTALCCDFCECCHPTIVSQTLSRMLL